jgi:hypothetical protein
MAEYKLPDGGSVSHPVDLSSSPNGLIDEWLEATRPEPRHAAIEESVE